MFQSVLMMGGLGIVIGTVLVIASKVFYVYEDPKIVAIDEALPGANCGGCGYPGCNANAEAIVKGLSGVNSCVAAGEDVALSIARIMGVSVSDKEPEFAGPGCYYGKDDADREYHYIGVTDCRAADRLFGGMKVCRIGCLGLGTCVRACLFGALSIGDDGLPRVDQSKCTGCGACERVCPKHIIRLTSVTQRIMREYTDEECITPCQRACPTGIDIKEYIRMILEGDYEGSVRVSKERNPFPTVISRICPAPCEANCRRLLQDESVAINHLKRFACDYEMNQNKCVLPYKAPSTGKRVAIIGGGVEGLSAAYFSARLGHDPTVFEATDVLGGILRVAIARERLPMDVLDWDIEGVKQMGVRFKTHVTAGIDFTIDGLLKQGFHAVFTATGGWDSRLATGNIHKVPTVFPGAYLLIDLLRSKSDKNSCISSGKNVVIAGDGIRVPDAVAILKENGSKNITIFSRRYPETSSFDSTVIDTLSQAGARVVYNTGITKVMGEAGHLTKIEYVELDTGLKHDIDTDTLIIGSGRFPELVFVPVCKDEAFGIQAGAGNDGPLVWEGVELQKKPDANRELGLLSNQDVTSEYASAVAAINGGRKAAAAIHNLMLGIPFQEPSKFITEQSILQDVSSLINVDILPRNIIQLAPAKKGSTDDFSTGFSKEQAHAEAARCLRCGLVCYEKSKAAG
ncbi:RnfABCDGE type electron transport complex subunit B [Desulfobacula sp.]|uniref:RnfABCDGE type electron transport complex subunit B n=1 Tax=Desulfobacula sp. TaxID=2593537 RepID=UPI00262B59F9|nr:RnfABCDGE type electron transport complex subunit B [Desulfobacula sp.]